MIRDGANARRVVTHQVRLAGGEAVGLVLQVTFNAAGAVVGVAVSLPPAPRCTAAETQGALLVEAVGGKLRRRPDLGLAELRRRAEAALALLEQLEDIEAAHGEEARAFLAAGSRAA